MTEAQFWCFLERMWEVKGREAMMAGMVDNPDTGVVPGMNWFYYMYNYTYNYIDK